MGCDIWGGGVGERRLEFDELERKVPSGRHVGRVECELLRWHSALDIVKVGIVQVGKHFDELRRRALSAASCRAEGERMELDGLLEDDREEQLLVSVRRHLRVRE